MSVHIKLDGQVYCGRGKATVELFDFKEELDSLVKETLCAGSLNVVLNRPIRLLETAAFMFDGDHRMLWPASLNGLDVWIYRWRVCPLHIVEVLSSVRLRERFQLKDGDDVILEISDAKVGTINPIGQLAWAALWRGRRHWSYSSDAYYKKTMNLNVKLGAAQQQPVVKGPIRTILVAIKEVVKEMPIVGPLARKLRAKYSGADGTQRYVFSRLETDGCEDDDERLFRQIQNVLNFTKTSNSIYSAQRFPAGYHTININDRRIQGQRDPSKRLALVPVDFRDKTVLDLGCNQGGMIHQLAGQVKWGVGVDFDSRMINAANRIKNAMGANNTHFYVLDLQKEPLDLISDFLPDQKVDICFLLSVCMWLNNWQEVIDFAQAKSESMLFETNGTSLQQEQQVGYLRVKYRGVDLISESSDDDPDQKQRMLFYLTEPVSSGKI